MQRVSTKFIRSKPKIFFGYYEGLGDLISDARIIDLFYKKHYDVTISVAEWLGSLAITLFPNIGITKCDTLKQIINQPYNVYDYVVLTPNYLDRRIANILVYVLKYLIVKYKSTKNTTILAYDMRNIIGNAVRREMGYLDVHMFDRSLGLLRNHSATFNDISRDEIIRLSDGPSGCNTTKPVISEIFIFPFSGWQNKDYGLDNFLSLGKALEAVAPQVPITFFVNAEGLKKTDASVRKSWRFENRSLLELVKMFSRDVLVIANDSGPAHLAAYCNANTITLFGPTTAEKYRPIGGGCNVFIASQSKVVRDIEVDRIMHAVKDGYWFKKAGYAEVR